MKGCATGHCWTIKPSAIERGITSTTSHRKNNEEKTSVYEPGGNYRGIRDSVSHNYGRVVLDRSSPQSILENHAAQNYNAERTRIVSEPFDRDIGNYDMDRHQSITGSVNGWDPCLRGQCSSSCQKADDVLQAIDGCGRAAPSEVGFGGNDIGIMFTQAAFEGFIGLWEMYMQGATSVLESLNNNTPSEPDEVCNRLIQVKRMRTVRSGFGPLFDLYQARLELVRSYEAYAEFEAQVQAKFKFRHHRAIPLDDLNDPVVLQRARRALAKRKKRALAKRKSYHEKNLLIENLTNRVGESEGDLEQIGPGQESIAEGADNIERDVVRVGVANLTNKILVDCLNARTGNNFTPKQRAGRKRDIIRFSIEARMYALFVKSFGLGILALMPRQCHFRFSKRWVFSIVFSPSPANANSNSDMKHKDSDMERDILSFVNENPRLVEFCRIIEEEYMTIVRNNTNIDQPDPRHDVRLQMILASTSLGTLGNRSQPDLPAKLQEPSPGQGKASRMVHEQMQESYTTERLPCIECKVKKIGCSYQIDLSACEECRKKEIRCIKELPSAEHCQLSSTEARRDLGRSVDSVTLQHRSITDLTRDDGVAGPTPPNPTSYPGSCQRCGYMHDCAWCPGSDGYRFLCRVCGHGYLKGKQGNGTINHQLPMDNHVARQFSPALNERTESFSADVAIPATLSPAPLDQQSTDKKRRASASVAIQEDQDAIRRAKNREKTRKYRAKKAQETEDLRTRKEALEAALVVRADIVGFGDDDSGRFGDSSLG